MISHQIWELKLEDVFNQHLDYLVFMHLNTKLFWWISKLEKDTPYIFASSHGFVEDIQALIATLDRNAYILTGAIDQLENHPNFMDYG